MTSVAVIGGGISGLSAAYYLSKAPHLVNKVVLLEGSSRLGGWLQSTRTEEGAIFEHGPRSLRVAGEPGANILGMADDLGLTDQILPVLPSHEGAKNRFIYAGGKLHKLPSNFRGLFRRYELFANQSPALMGLREPFVKGRQEEGDESVHSFFCRRLGKQFTDNAIDPMVRGIYGGDCRQLSVQALFPSIQQAERRKGSITRGLLFGPKKKESPLKVDSELLKKARQERWALWSLKDGLEALSNSLQEYLMKSGVELLTDRRVETLEFDTTNQVVQVNTLDEQLQVNHVISAVPSQCLSQMFAGNHPILSENLSVNPSATIGLVNLEFSGSVLPSEGFGYLVPSGQPERILGAVFDSSIFPQHNRPNSATTRLTVMMGGTWFCEQFGDPNEVDTSLLLDVALETMSRHLNITSSPLRSFTTIQKDCIPQYTLGHTDRLEQMESYIAEKRLPLSLVGCSYRGVGVNDCVLDARKAVTNLLKTHERD
ncbi:protoporphyrinogen oxidase-like [Branchiostoma floridae]|uniref:Protoporphyrinogen oxidase n=1 Tax=Branchiostoma floridae TaxID=7739 RepID=A0A9J7HHN9_BRAFL|nr:protoporphyrinogen oxidase-like [Branchiostoma floridae]